jgi:hypothetical protein
MFGAHLPDAVYPLVRNNRQLPVVSVELFTDD